MSEKEAKTVSTRLKDSELIEFMESTNISNSDIVREGIRKVAAEQGALGVEGLSGDLETAYQWLMVDMGGDMVGIEVAKTQLAQECQMSKDMVKSELIRPLQEKGFIAVRQGIRKVTIRGVDVREKDV